MKNNYNPYTVPDNFFRNCSDKAVSDYKRRRRTLRRILSATAIVTALIVLPLCLKQKDAAQPQRLAEQELPVNNLAQMYEYDIFLQVNF